MSAGRDIHQQADEIAATTIHDLLEQRRQQLAPSFDRVGYWRPRLEAFCWQQQVEPVADGTSAPTIAKRRRVLRALALACMRPGLRAEHDLIYLPGEETWLRRTPLGAWRPISAAELHTLTATIFKILQSGQRGNHVDTSGDADDVLYHLGAARKPLAYDEVPPEQRHLPWSRETGEVFPGAPLLNSIVTVTETGAIEAVRLTPSIVTRTVLPFAWRGTADVLPPRFREFLDQILPDTEDQLALCRIIGCMLAGDAPGAQGFLLLRGVGGSGKGTLLRLLGRLFGTENTAAEAKPGNLAGRFATARLRAKRLLVIEDMPARPRSGPELGNFEAGLGIIKGVTGGDTLDYEIKHGERGEFKPEIAVAIATNFGSTTFAKGAEDADAWGRRIWMFDLPRSIPEAERVVNYEQDVLGPEHADIFSFCLSAYARFKGKLGRAPTAADLRSPAMLQRSAELVHDAEGAAGEFVRDRIAVPDPDAVPKPFTPTTAIKAAYGSFIKAEPQQGHMRDLLAVIRKAGAEGKKRNGERGFLVTLRPAPTQEATP